MGEILVVLVFALVVLGPKKIPEIAKSLGKGLREFQKAKDDFMGQMNEAPPAANPPANVSKEDKQAEIVTTNELPSLTEVKPPVVHDDDCANQHDEGHPAEDSSKGVAEHVSSINNDPKEADTKKNS